jgi:hypothetical protein
MELDDNEGRENSKEEEEEKVATTREICSDSQHTWRALALHLRYDNLAYKL